ncbi:MAG: CoA-binding protein [Bacteroidia bacterium]|nr:CoA-binding protein [Bacteroidia bacterium]
MGVTVVIGASEDPSRYSWKAVTRLAAAGEVVYPLGIKNGVISGLTIHTDRPRPEKVDTVSLYISPRHLPEWEDYILSLKPKRLIFNPGTEEAGFREIARKAGIEVLEACTLVMLSVGNY